MSDNAYNMSEDERGIRAFCDSINLCGCGTPEDFHKVIHEALNIIRDEYDKSISDTKNDKKTQLDLFAEKFTKEEFAYMLMTVLDCFRLTTHGSSIRFSYPDTNGDKLVELYEKYGYEESSWPSNWLEIKRKGDK